MTAVTRQLVFSKLFRNDEGETVVFPLSITACHGNHVAVTQLSQALHCQSRPDAPGAVHDYWRVLIRDRLLNLQFKETSRQEDSTRQMPFLPFILLPDVQENKTVTSPPGNVHIMNADFPNVFLSP